MSKENTVVEGAVDCVVPVGPILPTVEVEETPITTPAVGALVRL